ncbi:MAG: SDR family oxidoreductase [Albidovulum sp.]|nr:SDR family oxidoreductase [Albidovulum sp.]
MRFSECKAIVTGGASGLGQSVAREFSDAGADVFIFDINEAKCRVSARGIGCGYAVCSVTDELSVQSALSEALSKMGGLTALVNCAGIADSGLALARNGPHSQQLFEKVVGINLEGTFNTIRLAAEIMANNLPNESGERGVIVNTSSIAAFDGQRGQSAYSASKAGVAGMTLPLARDLGPLGIRVNSIAPGVFSTPMVEGLPDKACDRLISAAVFPKRLGNPKEFSRLVRFLIECSYMNGETVRIDAALRMN